MHRYIIPVWWSMCADFEVEANNLKEAIQKVEDDSDHWQLDGEYIDGSFTVNIECAEELNNERYDDDSE